ncbi:MAG TPA: Rieske 2Fe-2S domain-containing protein [Chloroflexota bacterium]|nr:Rieske 2Fe-2S domain-containing protein [Chloroflexota bacterium]
MLTKEENERLTRVGPGTPAGELLRRYWHPVAIARELTDDRPTKFVRILGEDLVLFKDKSGNVGLMQDHCVHRGASMLYGRVEERGIACAYHGWLYDTKGNCLETPAEPADSKFYLTVKAKAYPVKKFIGMYWAYLGPLPAPEIPQYDVWARKDGIRKLAVYPQLDCNWLNPTENSVDPAHLQILHQEFIGRGKKPPSTTRGFTDDVRDFVFYESDYGIVKKRTYANGHVDQHPLIFPNILRQANATQLRVPMDDTHTNVFFVYFLPIEQEGYSDDDPDVIIVPPFKDPVDQLHPFTRFKLDQVLAQDHMAWETQGAIADREHERLATSDRGVAMLREVLKREIDKVERGLDPLAVVRDPNHGIINTFLTESLAEGWYDPAGRGGPTVAKADDWFDPGAEGAREAAKV